MQQPEMNIKLDPELHLTEFYKLDVPMDFFSVSSPLPLPKSVLDGASGVTISRDGILFYSMDYKYHNSPLKEFYLPYRDLTHI